MIRLLLLFLCAATVGSARADSLRVVVEPGIVTDVGEALVPFRILTAQGATFRAAAGEVALELGGQPIAAELVEFGVDGLGTDVLCLVDAGAFEGVDASRWAGELATLAVAPGTRIRFLGETSDVAEAGVFRKKLEKGGRERLWDGVLDAIGGLSREGASERRALIVVTNGVDGKESKHPMVTCVEAADSARVPVWAVTPRALGTTDEAGVARLRELAGRTGGEFFADGSAAALTAAARSIASAQGLRARAGGASGALVIRPGLASSGPAPGSLQPRKRLAYAAREPMNPVPVVAGLLAAGLALGLVLRHRPVGTIKTISGAQAMAVSVTRAGVTLGGAHGNAVVLDHPKISRNHAVVRVKGGEVTLVDLKSSNGTRLNGRPIDSAPLKHGDRILLADEVELLFERRFRFGRST